MLPEDHTNTRIPKLDKPCYSDRYNVGLRRISDQQDRRAVVKSKYKEQSRKKIAIKGANGGSRSQYTRTSMQLSQRRHSQRPCRPRFCRKNENQQNIINQLGCRTERADAQRDIRTGNERYKKYLLGKRHKVVSVPRRIVCRECRRTIRHTEREEKRRARPLPITKSKSDHIPSPSSLSQ